MSKRKRWALIAAVWACAITVMVLNSASPAFARFWDAELFPIGALTGWLAHGSWMRRRGH